jgi:hypothetical protein
MKHTIVPRGLLLWLLCTVQKEKCRAFKTGHFTYADPDYSELVSLKNDSIQTDTYPKASVKTISARTCLS